MRRALATVLGLAGLVATAAPAAAQFVTEKPAAGTASDSDSDSDSASDSDSGSADATATTTAAADADATATTATAADPATGPVIDLRLISSSFVYRESGDAGAPFDGGTNAPDDASPIRRFFSDLRLRLAVDRLGGEGRGVNLDARVRTTATGTFQAGAGSGSEYELRAVSYRHRLGRVDLELGRQTVREIAATKIDGVALRRPLGRDLALIGFAGAYPVRGSRSLDTDYPALHDADDPTVEDGHLVPFAAGTGLAYHRPTMHGDLGVGGILAPSGRPGIPASARRRAFVSASGYLQLGRAFNAYHYGVVDLGGAGGAGVTNLSVGLNGYPAETLQLSASLDHVRTELLEIAARDLLADPDPGTMGLVRNDLAVTRVASDSARLGVSLALARHRFEVALASALRRRPTVDVELVGGGTVGFAASESIETSLTVLDRRSLAGLRLAATATVVSPLDRDPGGAASGVVVRTSAAHRFADERGELEVDLAGQSFRDLGPRGDCTSLDPLSCLGASTTRAVEAGALASLRTGDRWQLTGDLHVGVEKLRSTGTMGELIDWPALIAVTGFVRLEWRLD